MTLKALPPELEQVIEAEFASEITNKEARKRLELSPAQYWRDRRTLKEAFPGFGQHSKILTLKEFEVFSLFRACRTRGKSVEESLKVISIQFNIEYKPTAVFLHHKRVATDKKQRKERQNLYIN